MPWLPSVIWLVLLVAFAVAEALTVGLVSVWFAAGALAALLSTFFTANIWWQITIFLAVSLLSMAVIRPLAPGSPHQRRPCHRTGCRGHRGH